MRTLSVILILSFLAALCMPLSAAKKRSDDVIYDEVRRKLANDMTAKGGGFEVEVKDGVVTLRGRARTERQKNRAETVAKKVKGVTKVINELTVEP